MLLRMYLRWTADRGFQTELVEASPGEEAGLKSGTLTVRGENAYGSSRQSAASTGWFASLHTTRRTAGTPRSRRSSSLRCSRRTRTSRSTKVTSGSTPTARAAPEASTSTRPTPPRGSPISPPGSLWSARTSVSQTSNKQTAMRTSARGSPSSPRRSARPSSPGSGSKVDVGFGSAIRSDVLHPYQMVKRSPHGLRGGKRAGRARREPRRLRPGVLLARAAGKA